MPSIVIEQLLILQDRDIRCDHLNQQLAHIPQERATILEAIEGEKLRIKEAQGLIVQAEVRRNEVEGAVEDVEARMVKYKTQQMMVKKNDEYAALGNEIEGLEQQISDFEDQELELLELIDRLKLSLEEIRAAVEKEVRLKELRLATLDEAEANCKGEIAEAEASLVKAREGTEREGLQIYDFVKEQRIKPPYVVAVKGGQCQGCRLKVSGEVESAARKGSTEARCESCRRLVYWEC